MKQRMTRMVEMVDASATRMDCPVCGVDLVMSERMGIEIDYSPKCRGVWLDRGELDKIIERSLTEAPQAPPAPTQPIAPVAPLGYAPDNRGGYRDDHGGHGGHGGGGHHGGGHGSSHRRSHGGGHNRSFLGRLFD